MILPEDEECMEAIARCIGMNRRMLKRVVDRQHALEDGVDGQVWAFVQRRQRKDAL